MMKKGNPSCSAIDPLPVSKEFDGGNNFVSGEVIRFFMESAQDLCEDGVCLEGKCTGYFRDLKIEPGSVPSKRTYTAELYCLCE